MNARTTSLVLALMVAAGFAGYTIGSMPAARAADAPSTGLPSDVYADSRSRVPLIKREQLDAAGQALGREAVGKHSVASATFATAERLFGREQLINYVSLMGDYAGTGILLTTFDQHLPAGGVSKLPVP
jgi:hypothetical protein